MTPSIFLIVLVILLGMLALGWSCSRRQQCKPALEPGGSSHNMPLPGKRLTALRTHLRGALLALSLAGVSLLLVPQPPALAASAQHLNYLGGPLTAGQYLSTGDYMGTNYFFALMQSDGNFCIYHGTGPSDNHGKIWCTNTGGQTGGQFFALMQSDGNFVIDKGTGPSNNQGQLWATNTGGQAGGQFFAELTNSGDFQIHQGTTLWGGPLLWASHSSPGPDVYVYIVSGSNQSVGRTALLGVGEAAGFAPLSVVTKDNFGNLLVGEQITWSVKNKPAAMYVMLTPNNTGATSTTDANGIATLKQLGTSGSSTLAYSAFAFYAVGTFNVVASYGVSSATFNETVSS